MTWDATQQSDQHTTRKYTDINLNLNLNPITNDVTTITDVDAVKRSVINLLNTQHYERPFHPEIGSAIQHLLFEDFGPITANRLRRAIEEVLANHEDRITVTSIDVDQRLNDYYIVIAFVVKNNPSVQEELETVLETVR